MIMYLSELNLLIETLDANGEIELLNLYCDKKKDIIRKLACSMEAMIFQTIQSKGIEALNKEELEIAQYLMDRKKWF